MNFPPPRLWPTSLSWYSVFPFRRAPSPDVSSSSVPFYRFVGRRQPDVFGSSLPFSRRFRPTYRFPVSRFSVPTVSLPISSCVAGSASPSRLLRRLLLARLPVRNVSVLSRVARSTSLVSLSSLRAECIALSAPLLFLSRTLVYSCLWWPRFWIKFVFRTQKILWINICVIQPGFS